MSKKSNRSSSKNSGNKSIFTTIAVVIIIVIYFFTRSPEEQEVLVNEWMEDITSEVTESVSGGTASADDQVKSVMPAEAGGVIEVVLDRVVDGDTIVVDKGNTSLRIRLIGIDTPESVSPDKEKNNIYGEYASDYVKELLEETDTLYLEYDVEETDSFDRVLAYVWLDDDFDDLENMLNYKIVYDGYGINKEYPPNLKYAEKLEMARADAILEIRGLWKYDEYHELVD